MPHEGETKTWLETEHGDQIAISGICSIGRAESNNIILNQSAVSRHHALIHEREREYWITDLGGVNGLLLNGSRVIQPTQLRSGDRIQIPTADFIFHREGASSKTPSPIRSKSAQPLETPLEITPRPTPLRPPTGISSPTAVTVPLPRLTKPTQQDELPLGLPPEPAQPTGKLKKPRVYVGPVETQGTPKILLTQTAQPGTLKPAEAPLVSKPFFASHLPPPAENPLKNTTPLSPPVSIDKPGEMLLINAPDVIVPTVEKGKKTPPFLTGPVSVKANSSLQPPPKQNPLSATKSIAPPRRTLETNPLPTVTPQPATPQAKEETSPVKTPPLPLSQVAKEVVPPFSPSTAPLPPTVKPEPAKPVSSVHTVPPMLASSEPKDQKKTLKKGVPPALREEGLAKPEIALMDASSPEDIPVPKTVPCPSAKYSLYIGLGSIFLPFVGLLTAVVAIILGHSALRKIKQSRGMLSGRQSAVMGLSFGYITLVLISGYSILFYILFSAPPTQTDKLVHSASAPATIVLGPSSPTSPPTNLPPATAETALLTPSTPASVQPPPPEPHTATPSPQASTPPVPATPDQTSASASTPPPSPPPAPDTTPASPTETTPGAPPPAIPSTPPTIISDSAAGNAPPPPPSAPSSPADTNIAPSIVSASAVASVPISSPTTPAVYDPVVQNRLKDGMLTQPMPQDTTSRAYSDAESFNNCARILARPPEAKYAESVGDFLDDVKTRNPDAARLQILSAMYENYMAGIKREP